MRTDVSFSFCCATYEPAGQNFVCYRCCSITFPGFLLAGLSGRSDEGSLAFVFYNRYDGSCSVLWMSNPAWPAVGATQHAAYAGPNKIRLIRHDPPRSMQHTLRPELVRCSRAPVIVPLSCQLCQQNLRLTSLRLPSLPPRLSLTPSGRVAWSNKGFRVAASTGAGGNKPGTPGNQSVQPVSKKGKQI